MCYQMRDLFEQRPQLLRLSFRQSDSDNDLYLCFGASRF